MLVEKTGYTWFKQPRYPDFPYQEWRERIKRAQELMAKNEIDLLMLWKREDVRYYFGFQTTHWEMPSLQPAVGLIPVEGDPVLVVPSTLHVNAEAFCWTRDLRVQPKPHEVPSERGLPKDVAELIKEMGYEKKSVGLESGELGCIWIPRPLNDIEILKNSLPDVKFVDGDKVIWGCRMIKSTLEIDRIRKATQIIAKCHSNVVEEFRPGMTEMDVAKIIYRTYIEEGALQGGDTTICNHIVCNLEKEGIWDILGAEEVTVHKDDYLQLDLQCKWKGYWSDIGRIFQTASITDRIRKNYELVSKAKEAAVEKIIPGVKANEIYNAAAKVIKDAGIEPPDMAGHGIGMDIHEPPSIDATNEMALQEGMTFAIETWLATSLKRDGGEGFFGVEDIYVCTDKGYEEIKGLREDIIQVSHVIR